MNFLLAMWLLAQFEPSNTGELRVTVNDATGLPVRSAVELVSQANQVQRALQTDEQGKVIARQLPFTEALRTTAQTRVAAPRGRASTALGADGARASAAGGERREREQQADIPAIRFHGLLFAWRALKG